MVATAHTRHLVIDVCTDDGWNEALATASTAAIGNDTEHARLGRAYLAIVDLHTASCVEREQLRTLLDTERARTRTLEAKLGAMADKAQVAINERDIARRDAAELREKLQRALRERDEIKLDLSRTNEQLAFERGRREAAESELAAERHRHQETALLLEAAGVEHSPRAGTAVQLDAYEIEAPAADLSAEMSLGARLAMTARPCAALSVMADALHEPDCAVDDEPTLVREAEQVGGGL